MGQQQLLLLILSSIIIGIALVVAITTFTSAGNAMNLDAVRNDMINIGAFSQSYFNKPEMLGGGSNSFNSMTFRSITFPSDSISSNGMIAYNANGTYTLSYLTVTSIRVTAVPSRNSSEPLSADIMQSDMVWNE